MNDQNIEADIARLAAEETASNRRGLLIGAGLLLLLGLLYLLGVFMTGQRMAADTKIAGVDVSGMSPSSARTALTKGIDERLANPVTLRSGDSEFVIKPEEVELAVDVPASVEEAGGHYSWDPRDIWALIGGRGDVAPVVTADPAKLKDTAAKIAAEVDVPVTEALITFPESVPTPREPVDGLAVRKKATGEAILGAYVVATKPTSIPTRVIEPAVDKDGLAKAMTEIAAPAVAEPVHLDVGGTKVDLPVAAFTPALEVRVEKGAMTPYIDPVRLAEPLTSNTTGFGEKAVDAKIDVVNGAVVITPSKPGIGLQPEEMATKLLPVLTKAGAERTLAIEAKPVQPKFTTEAAQALNIKEKMGEFTTYFPYAEYRNTNQGRAARLINGTLLKPGEIFSMNKIVGERTAANGFVQGFVISGGAFKEEQGGGVSQVATTTYNAAFFAGLEDVEHKPHTFYISRYPMGREATVYYGSLDMRFKNNTPNGVLVKASVKPSTPGSQGVMHVEIWGTKTYTIQAGLSPQRNFREPGERWDTSPTCVEQSPIRGFDVTVYRYFFQNGAKVRTESKVASYKAADTIHCSAPPPAPAPPPPPS